MSIFDIFKDKEKVSNLKKDTQEKKSPVSDSESHSTDDMTNILEAMKQHHESKGNTVNHTADEPKDKQMDNSANNKEETNLQTVGVTDNEKSANMDTTIEKHEVKKPIVKQPTKTKVATQIPTHSVTNAPQPQKNVAQQTIAKPKLAHKKVTQPIIVTYVDEKGTKIANDYIFNGNFGDTLRMDDIPCIPGYRFVTKGRPKYKVSDAIQNIKIVCKKDIVSYRIIPILENHKKIKGVNISPLQGKPGDKIDPAKFPQIPGYTAYLSRTYKVPKLNGDVEVTYSALPQTVNIIYQTDSGKQLASPVQIKGKTGEEYTIDLRANKFPGYEISKQPDSLTNTFDPQITRQVVRFVPITTKVIVEFLDESGNAIHKSQIYSGKYQQSYRLNLPKIPGYELTSDSTLLNGTFDKTNKTIVLRFRKSTVNFHIHFWLNKDKTQSAGHSRKIQGVVGDPYTITVPQLEGYIPSLRKIEGKFLAENNKDYDVIYSRIHCQLTIVLDDLTGHPIKNVEPIKLSGDWGQPFKITLPQLEGYERPSKIYQGRFTQANQVDHVNYEPKSVYLMVSFVDAKTKKEITAYPAQRISGTVGLTYNISPQLIDGYRITKLPDNAHGVFSAEPENVVFEYEPVPSELVIHTFGNAHTPLTKAKVLKGYYGEPYEIKAEEIPGYEFESSTAKLKGTFPSTRQDIELKYNAANVKFRIVPTRYDKAAKKATLIDDRYIMDVTGLVNERWSLLLPEIPGYERPKRKGSDESVLRIGDYIRPEMDGKDIELKYTPKDETITVHFIFKGGAHDGQHPFKDFILTGKMDEKVQADLPQREGYTPEPAKITGTFTDEQQDFTVYYNVNYENYVIQYIEPNGNVVGQEAPARGYYGQAVEIKNLPEGYILPEVSNTNIILDGKGTVTDDDGNYKGIYQVPVEPKDVMVNIHAQTIDNMSLGVEQQLYGKYHQPQTIEVDDIIGYTPIDGNTITINFDLDQHDIPIVYEPKVSKITVRYFSTEGTAIKEPKVYEGHYQQDYSISAPQIPGYLVVSDDVRHGTYGAQDTDMAFTYRAGSDTQSKAIIPLDELAEDDISEIDATPKIEQTSVIQEPSATHKSVQDTQVGQDQDTTSQPEAPSISDYNQPTPATKINSSSQVLTQMPNRVKTENLNEEVNLNQTSPVKTNNIEQSKKEHVQTIRENKTALPDNSVAEQVIKPVKKQAHKVNNNNQLDPHSLFKKQPK